jgi:hypothetical protein
MKLGEEKQEKVHEKIFDKEDIVWALSVCTQRQLICFTSPTKLFVVKYDDEYK